MYEYVYCYAFDGVFRLTSSRASARSSLTEPINATAFRYQHLPTSPAITLQVTFGRCEWWDGIDLTVRLTVTTMTVGNGLDDNMGERIGA